MYLWQHPNLLLAQTCGLPFRQILHDKVHYAATPDYGIESCPLGYYKSIFVSGKEQSLGSSARGIFAFNEAHSQLGWAGPIDARENWQLPQKGF